MKQTLPLFILFTLALSLRTVESCPCKNRPFTLWDTNYIKEEFDAADCVIEAILVNQTQDKDHTFIFRVNKIFVEAVPTANIAVDGEIEVVALNWNCSFNAPSLHYDQDKPFLLFLKTIHSGRTDVEQLTYDTCGYSGRDDSLWWNQCTTNWIRSNNWTNCFCYEHGKSSKELDIAHSSPSLFRDRYDCNSCSCGISGQMTCTLKACKTETTYGLTYGMGFGIVMFGVVVMGVFYFFMKRRIAAQQQQYRAVSSSEDHVL